ncbi:MAG: recombinase family protein [Oligoflexia bacterium]|nr:recombinase family protein [Oligoflexia bacterium]
MRYQNSFKLFGEIKSVYIDKAKSGKDTKRSELKRLLSEIDSGKIDLVLVTELSRLSRNLKDFCSMWDLMRAKGCEFQSLREQFDTTTAAGEMVLLSIANFSQFERRQVSERVKANMLSRSKRGLFNGGAIPLGYMRDDNRKGHLLIHNESAKIVKESFKTFLKEGSLASAAKSLNDRGIRVPKKRIGKARVGHFTNTSLYRILTNKKYIGIKTYSENGKDLETKACWDAIVSNEDFNRTQVILKKNYRSLKSKMKNRYPYQLTGLLFCGKCGTKLSGKSANGNSGKVPYYEHAWKTTKNACLTKKEKTCSLKRIQSKKLEELVWMEVQKLLLGKFSYKLLDKAKSLNANQSSSSELESFKTRLKENKRQLEALAEHLGKLPKELDPTPIFKQMQELEKDKEKLEAKLQKIEQVKSDEAVSVDSYEKFLKSLRAEFSEMNDPKIRKKILERIIHRIEVFEHSIKIYYFVGKNEINQNLGGTLTSASIFSKYIGSNSLTNGGSEGTAKAPVKLTTYNDYRNLSSSLFRYFHHFSCYFTS